MSSITGALDKRKAGNETGADPNSILARNAVYREALRRGSRASARDRMKLILTGVSLGLAFMALLVMTAIMMSSPRDEARDVAAGTSDPANRMGSEDPAERMSAPTRTPAPTPLPTATPSPARPVVRERAQLRTRLLLQPHRSPDPRSVGPDRRISLQVTRTPMPTPTSEAASPSNPPTTPPQQPTTRQAPDDPREFLVLTGMLDDVNNPTALLNGRLVRIGETIRGAKVLAIDRRSSVRVEYKGKEYTIQLK